MDPFVAEIRIFPFNFAPKGWALCDGQIMSISQNTALFSLLGTTYGGDGKTTFALPNMQGNAPMHQGQGPGLSLHDLGETGGSQTVTLLQTEVAAHQHALRAVADEGDVSLPQQGAVLAVTTGATGYVAPTPTLTPMVWNSLAPAGGGLPHNNMQPYVVLNFCIALQGVYPPRT